MDSKIKNVVFDLGGVVINLDFDNCLNAFRKAGFRDIEKLACLFLYISKSCFSIFRKAGFRDIEKQACQFRGKGFFSQFELGEITCSLSFPY